MKNLKDFSDFLLEADNSDAQFIADTIQKSAGGPGTDEELLMNAIKAIPGVNTLVKVNQILSGNSKYSYKSVGDAINGELGFLDKLYKDVIMDHIKKIKAEKYITSINPPVVVSGDVIKQIIPRVKQHEGVKPKKYLDSRGIPTVGVGFNLKRSDADQKLKSVGANPVKVKQGKQALTTNQIETLLVSDLQASKKAVAELVPNLNTHPLEVQGVLIEMAFNLGKKGLSEFKNFLGNLQKKKYDIAAQEMLKSDWSKQVGQRAKTLSGIISSKA
jgi:GH24 family phage-related lysozyme (muramidase)